MITISFECNVTDFDITPKIENGVNIFVLKDNCLVINLINATRSKILMETEIEKESAIELARLILLKYTGKTI